MGNNSNNKKFLSVFIIFIIILVLFFIVFVNLFFVSDKNNNNINNISNNKDEITSWKTALNSIEQNQTPLNINFSEEEVKSIIIENLLVQSQDQDNIIVEFDQDVLILQINEVGTFQKYLDTEVSFKIDEKTLNSINLTVYLEVQNQDSINIKKVTTGNFFLDLLISNDFVDEQEKKINNQIQIALKNSNYKVYETKIDNSGLIIKLEKNK